MLRLNVGHGAVIAAASRLGWSRVEMAGCGPNVARDGPEGESVSFSEIRNP